MTDKKQRDEMIRLYLEENWTAKRIAEKFGVTPDSVKVRFKRWHIYKTKDGFGNRKIPGWRIEQVLKQRITELEEENSHLRKLIEQNAVIADQR